MKIGNFWIEHHKHKWEKVILAEYRNEHGKYVIKVGEKCSSKDCHAGYYKSIYYVECENEPKAFHVS